jgi:hypothetical protein
MSGKILATEDGAMNESNKVSTYYSLYSSVEMRAINKNIK